MAVDMTLVRADPTLEFTPYLMEEAEKGPLDLQTYTFLLLKDLAAGPDPFKRARSLVNEGNVALARRFVAAYRLSEKETAEIEGRCRQIESATRALLLKVDRQMTRLRSFLEPGLLSKCSSLRDACQAAIRQERYHIAQRELIALQDILSDVEKSSSEQAIARLAQLGDDSSIADADYKATKVASFPVQVEDLEPLSWLDSAIAAWAETTSGFSSPLRAWLRPDDSADRASSYLNVRQLLQVAQRVEEGWRQRSENALRQYFYLSPEDRLQLKDLFFQSLVVYALECLKESISYRDFDTGNLVHDDLIQLFGADTEQLCPDQIVYDTCRYGAEVQAALFGQDTSKSFEQFNRALFEQARKRPRYLNPERANKILDYGKVLFFYYRIQSYKRQYQELIQFYVEHYTTIDNLARGDIELNRFLEMARVKYNDALYHKTESELTGLELPTGIAFSDTPHFLKGLPPYQIVSALRSIQEKFADSPDDELGALMPMYSLVLTLFDIQKPEELVFVHRRLSGLIEELQVHVIRASANGEENEYIPVTPAGLEKMHAGVLQTLESFVENTIAAVSKTDFLSVRQHIAYALENIREQRAHLQDTGPAIRHLWHMLGDHWISILVGMQRAISRQTSLNLGLQSEEIIADEESSLVVYLENDGPGIARQIEIALISSDLSIRPAIQRCPILAPGDESSLSFNVKPRTAGGHFEIKLLVRYLDPDDNPIISSESRALISRKFVGKSIPRRSPYVWGQPLAKDSEVFFGREDAFDFLKARFWGEERNKIVALQGERRMGKTSILYQLEKRKIFGNYRVVMFDFQGRYANIDSVYEFLFNFARRIRSQARLPAELQVDKSDFLVSARGYYDVFEEWLDRAEEELEQRDTQVVILFDEFEKLLSRRFDDSVNANPRLVEELLQYIRSIMLTRKKFNWVITGSWSLVARQREYFSSLFGMAISYWVSYLKREDAIALIQEPVQSYLAYDQDAVERILRLTGGHPFYIQMICDALFNRARSLNSHRVQVNDVNWVLHDTLQQVTESSFRTSWASLSSSTSRKVLASVAEAMQDPCDYVLKKNVLNFLHRKSPRLDEDMFYAVLDEDSGELIRRELIEVHPNDPERVRIRSELLHRWLCKSKPLATVLREEV